MSRLGEHELLEREAELGEIAARLDGAAAGKGSVTAIVGPAGVGKTTLLVEARQSATERGLSCLHAAGAELEATMPFGVVRGLFERTVVGLAETERAALMSGAARLAAPVLSLAEELERPQPVDAGFAALHGLYWLSANLAQSSPLLLAVDDAHWADAASLRFLAYLAQRADELPIALLVATRPPEPGARPAVLEALLSSPATGLLAPRPLSEPAVAALIGARLGTAPKARVHPARPRGDRRQPVPRQRADRDPGRGAGRPERRRHTRARAPHPRDDRAIGPAAARAPAGVPQCAGERHRGARTHRRGTRRRSPRRARGTRRGRSGRHARAARHSAPGASARVRPSDRTPRDRRLAPPRTASRRARARRAHARRRRRAGRARRHAPARDRPGRRRLGRRAATSRGNERDLARRPRGRRGLPPSRRARAAPDRGPVTAAARARRRRAHRRRPGRRPGTCARRSRLPPSPRCELGSRASSPERYSRRGTSTRRSRRWSRRSRNSATTITSSRSSSRPSSRRRGGWTRPHNRGPLPGSSGSRTASTAPLRPSGSRSRASAFNAPWAAARPAQPPGWWSARSTAAY